MLIIFLFVLVLLSGFFSGSEVALVGIRESKVKTLLKEKKKGVKSLDRLKRHPKRMLITILIGNNVVNILASSIVAVLITDRFGSIGLGIATGLMTIVILIAGEIIPKTFATSHTVKVALLVAPLIEALSIILYPAVYLLDKLAIMVNNLVKIRQSDKFDESEVMSVLDIAYEQNVLDKNVKGIMEKSLKFGKISINEIMVPISQVYTLKSSMKIREVLDDIVESGYSRIPIYKKSTDNIIGIVLIKDILREVKDNNLDKKLEEFAITPIFVSPLTHADNLLEYFKSKHEQFGLVKENNKITGIISIEDILEELVGEITDETDITPLKFLIVNNRKIIAHPMTEIRIVNSYFNKKIKQKNENSTILDLLKEYETGNKVGSMFISQNLEFKIHKVDSKGEIKLVSITNKTMDDYFSEAFRKIIPQENLIKYPKL